MDQQQASSANQTSGSPELLCAPLARPVTEVKERSSPHELMKKLGDTAPSSKGATIRILHLEDEPDFCRLVEDFLAADGMKAEVVIAGDLSQFNASLEQERFDIILADFRVPNGTGMEALKQATRRCPETPFVLVSGALNERMGAQALRDGATDYVLKQSLERLPAVVHRAIEQASEKARLSRVESNLAKREQYCQALTENSLDVLSILSLTGFVQYTSPSTKHVLGYESAELVGREVFSFVHPEDVVGAKEAFQNAIRNPGLRVRHELRFRRRDGSWCDLEVIGQNRVDEPEIGGLVLNSRDVCDRKRDEGRLRLQSVALEAAANAIAITDRTGRVIWANPAFSNLTGYAQEEIIGQSPRLLKSGQHDQAFYQNLWQTILAGKVWQSEMVNRHKEGHLYTEESTITPVLDEHGTITHFIAVKQDVSERKRAEAELEQIHRQLVAASKQAAVAEFATRILHNVGNVLNSVGVASECLAESLKKSKSARLSQAVNLMVDHRDELGGFFKDHPKGKLVLGYLSQLADKLISEQAKALEEIAQLQRSVEHIKAIITLQQNSAKGSTTPELVSAAELFEEVLQMNRNALARHNIRVVKEYAQTSPVMLQKHRVVQILLNLIRNAIQACEASDWDSKVLNVKIELADSRLRMAVADNGVGITSEGLPRVFDLGFTTKKDGHGFGLHGALADAKDMGGSLAVQSEGPGRGATFTLELPLLEPVLKMERACVEDQPQRSKQA
jgi:PAS domain S-box-containing protein